MCVYLNAFMLREVGSIVKIRNSIKELVSVVFDIKIFSLFL